MASSASTAAAAEQVRLVQAEDASEQLAGPPPALRGRRLVLGAVLSAAVAAGVLWKAFAPCREVNGISDNSASSFVDLAEQYPEDLNDLLDGHNDEETRKRWLQAALTMSPSQIEEQTAEAEAKTRETVRRALESDPAEAKKLVARAMTRAVEKSKMRRRELKKLIHARRHFLKGDKKPEKEDVPTATGAPKAAEDHPSEGGHQTSQSAKKVKNMFAGVEEADREVEATTEHATEHAAEDAAAAPPPPAPPAEDPWDVHHAVCVIDVLQATTTVAAWAANINDLVKTCGHVEGKEFEHVPGYQHTAEIHAEVCAVNMFSVLSGMSHIAALLSASADHCAATLIPNIDASCAMGVTGLVTAISQAGGAMCLIGAACKPEGWYGEIPEGVFPHNVGSNVRYEQFLKEQKAAGGTSSDGRRLAEAPGPISEDSAPAPPRKLLFGGGRGSTATHCATELSGAMWYLATAGIAIHQAGGSSAPACPARNLWGETDPKKKGIAYKLAEGVCAVNVEGVITGFLGAISVLQLAAVNCVDTVNTKAICGTGVTGVLAGTAGLVQAATGVHLACNVLQDKPLKTLIGTARDVDMATGLLTNTNYGRRLAGEHAVEDLKRRFKTPEEAWMSIGYDFNNASALFRKAGLPEVDLKAFASLIEEEPEPVKGGGAGLFGGQSTCSS